MAAGESILKAAEHKAAEFVEGAERIADQIAPPAERDIVRRALDLPVRKKLLLMRRLWKDRRVRATTRLPMMAGLVYMILPIRLLPVRLGFLRQWEKLIGLAALLWLIVRITPEEILRQHLDEVEQPGMLRRFIKRG